jgi:hypothetical protein
VLLESSLEYAGRDPSLAAEPPPAAKKFDDAEPAVVKLRER